MDQGMINTIITLAGGIFGWLLKTLWDSVRMLEKADDMINEKVNRVEVLVAGEYVRREEFQDGVQLNCREAYNWKEKTWRTTPLQTFQKN
jgi:hypothetical protein